MNDELVMVFDCGSTNLRVVAVSPTGELVGQASRPNRAVPQPKGKLGWMVWDLKEIWSKLAQAAREVSAAVGSERIKAVTVTTWGADGAPVRRDGTLTYPPISWQCPRTKRVTDEIVHRMSSWEIFKVTGYQVIPFNTILKMIWLRKNMPETLDEAYTWLMMPGLLTYRFTGKFHIEPTSASTMMAMDLGKRGWSTTMLELAGLEPSFLPEWSEPGQVVGYVTPQASVDCGLRTGIPVTAGGHDTQFALVGSGAGNKEAILSSGTWEILELRVDTFQPNRFGFEEGLLIEADVQPGLWNPQLFWIGSAVLEWIREKLFTDLDRGYAAMIKEAQRVPAGAENVMLIPSFVRESGPTRKFGAYGTLLGLTLQTSRGNIYRAALEGLSFQLRAALEILTKATGFQVEGIRVVGGGSRNDLWNQIRADVTGLPITVTAQREATVLGAALTAFTGIGRYRSLDEAHSAVKFNEQCFKPSSNCSRYEELFKRYVNVPAALQEFYASQGPENPSAR